MSRFVSLVLLVLGLVAGCGSGSGGVKAAGTLTNPDQANSRFTIDPLTSFEGFVPKNNRVDVATTANTAFQDESGNAMTAQSFYTFVTTNAGVRVLHVAVEGFGGADLIIANQVRLTP